MKKEKTFLDEDFLLWYSMTRRNTRKKRGFGKMISCVRDLPHVK